ncbi:MAG TPA: histidine kinase dimerization/phospho-acceptor domain-containing protein [Tepidisphaeraceae bacterium]|jgi:signal transduction histidine kinase|nr:histidine kinase dimerization/phospho-acceptor domain-containing protein [Tepidisphaeraceae bacterium]
MESDVARLRHDLRNKVNALRLSISALEIAEDKQETLEWLETIIRAAERLDELLQENGHASDEFVLDFRESTVPIGTWNR